MNFYCKRACCSDDWTIEEFNNELELLHKGLIKEEEFNYKYHNIPPCTEQCFDCMAIVGETRIKNKKNQLK